MQDRVCHEGKWKREETCGNADMCEIGKMAE